MSCSCQYWFNRSILKCKLLLGAGVGVGDGGLIEAYWNVNIADISAGAACTIGLIEAYWNVNVAEPRRAFA